VNQARAQHGLVHRYELRRPGAFAFAEWALVDPVAQLPNRLVQFLNREKLPMPERGDDPAFH
jgi:hypothetical protein